ncbi:hypothetical protein QAD02_013459 [Eretmocerus hayati]|uniref:Uncharacterized protein n=1 Tax=Eretmocerus hayati TaxID=131215 RepID=A0ACC2P2S5_9HYME|nr:hypothetical protein QAD02_013459 [Eretmocerus hayati]
MFLLYAGPLVLRDVLTQEQYDNFMLFHVGCRILWSRDMYERYSKHAQQYLYRFVLSAETLYGLEFIFLNVHSVEHLSEDVKAVDGTVSDYTTFPFENEFGHNKKDIKSGNKPLEQSCSNIQKDLVFNEQKVPYTTGSKILKHKMTDNIHQVQKLKCKNFELTLKRPNDVILLRNGSLVRIKGMACSSIGNNPDKVHIVDQRSASSCLPSSLHRLRNIQDHSNE